MLNMLGLGLSLMAKDDGMSKTVDEAKGSVIGLSAALDGISNVAAGFDMVMRKGRELTTGFEANLMQMDKTGKSMAYNAGLSAEKMKEVTKAATGMSLGIGVSMEEATNATIEYERVQTQLKAVGISNATEFAKALNVMGMSATETREQFQLMGAVGIKSEAGIKALTGSFIESGKQLGNVRLGFQAITGTLKELDEISVGKTGKRLSEEEMVKLGKGVASTAAIFKSLGYNAEESMGTATDMFRQMTAQQTDFAKMFAGTVEDVPKGYEELSIITGDIRKSFDLMKQGPEGMVLGMKQLADAAKTKGADMDKMLSFVGARMEGVFGKEQTTKILKSMTQAGDKTIELAKKVSTATEGMGGAAAAYVDSRSLDEKMKILEDSFRTRLRNINRTGDHFLKDSANSFKLLGDEITNLSKGDGAVAGLTQALADFDQKGLIGLLPRDLQGTGAALGSFGGVVAGVLDKIRNPLSLISSGLVLFTTAVTDAFLKGGVWGELEGGGKRVMSFGERVQAAIEKVTERFVKFLEGVPETLTKWVDSAFEAVIDAFGLSTKQAEKPLKKVAHNFWDRIFGNNGVFTKLGPIFDRLRKFGSALWDGITGNVFASSADKETEAGNRMGLWLKGMWDKGVAFWDETVWPNIKKFFGDVWTNFEIAFTPEKDGDKNKKKGLGGSIGTWLGEVGKTVKDHVTKFLSDFWTGLTEGFDPEKGAPGVDAPIGQKLGHWLAGIMQTAFDLLKDKLPGMLWELTKAIVKAPFESVHDSAIRQGVKFWNKYSGFAGEFDGPNLNKALSQLPPEQQVSRAPPPEASFAPASKTALETPPATNKLLNAQLENSDLWGKSNQTQQGIIINMLEQQTEATKAQTQVLQSFVPAPGSRPNFTPFASGPSGTPTISTDPLTGVPR